MSGGAGLPTMSPGSVTPNAAAQHLYYSMFLNAGPGGFQRHHMLMQELPECKVPNWMKYYSEETRTNWDMELWTMIVKCGNRIDNLALVWAKPSVILSQLSWDLQ